MFWLELDETFVLLKHDSLLPPPVHQGRSTSLEKLRVEFAAVYADSCCCMLLCSFWSRIPSTPALSPHTESVRYWFSLLDSTWGRFTNSYLFLCLHQVSCRDTESGYVHWYLFSATHTTGKAFKGNFIRHNRECVCTF